MSMRRPKAFREEKPDFPDPSLVIQFWKTAEWAEWTHTRTRVKKSMSD